MNKNFPRNFLDAVYGTSSSLNKKKDAFCKKYRESSYDSNILASFAYQISKTDGVETYYIIEAYFGKGKSNAEIADFFGYAEEWIDEMIKNFCESIAKHISLDDLLADVEESCYQKGYLEGHSIGKAEGFNLATAGANSYLQNMNAFLQTFGSHEPNMFLNYPIIQFCELFHLSRRCRNLVRFGDYKFIRDLLTVPKKYLTSNIPQFGIDTLNELEETLNKVGIYLKEE